MNTGFMTHLATFAFSALLAVVPTIAVAQAPSVVASESSAEHSWYDNSWKFAMDYHRVRTRFGPGLYIDAVDPCGPAGRAGLECGDVILSIDGICAARTDPDCHDGLTHLQVINVRTGQIILVNVILPY